MPGLKRSTLVLKVGVTPTEYQPHEACNEVTRQSTAVYKVGMALTENI